MIPGRVVLFQLVGELREKRGTRVRDSCVFVCVTRIHALINTTDGALPEGPRPSLEINELVGTPHTHHCVRGSGTTRCGLVYANL